jgi:hypothetical protein
MIEIAKAMFIGILHNLTIEKLPPKIPIPDMPTAGSQEHFKCKICGKVFNSEEEINAHLKIDHNKK